MILKTCKESGATKITCTLGSVSYIVVQAPEQEADCKDQGGTQKNPALRAPEFLQQSPGHHIVLELQGGHEAKSSCFSTTPGLHCC